MSQDRPRVTKFLVAHGGHGEPEGRALATSIYGRHSLMSGAQEQVTQNRTAQRKGVGSCS